MRFLKGAAFPLGFLALWEIWMRAAGIHSDSLAPPSQIAVAFYGVLVDGTILDRTGQTLAAALAGLAIGGGLAVVFSVVLGLVPTFARLMQFSIEVLRPVPPVALIPIAMLIFGFGFSMEITLCAFACFWPVAIYGHAAIVNIEPQLLDLSRVLRLSPWARAVKIVLPAALPRYFVAFRLSAAVALIIAVTVEIAINPLGVGFELMKAAQSLHPARMFAMLLWIGFIGWCLNAALLFAQRRLFGPAGLAARAR
ncbi:MAG TPA: ABC transporter permease subunit [Stellaceae bacterium]|nr:ABC transporter permease subunit [Stellaceae bacterium]